MGVREGEHVSEKIARACVVSCCGGAVRSGVRGGGLLVCVKVHVLGRVRGQGRATAKVNGVHISSRWRSAAKCLDDVPPSPALC